MAVWVSRHQHGDNLWTTISACCLLVLLLGDRASAFLHLSYCKGKKIGILDLSELAKEVCSLPCTARQGPELA